MRHNVAAPFAMKLCWIYC